MMVSDWKRIAGVLLLTAACAAPMPAEDGDVLATVGEREITRAEVEEVVAGELLKVKQQEFDILQQGVDSLVEQALLELEAEARGVTPQELMSNELAARATEVTDADVDAFYEENKARINQPKDQIAERVRQFLIQQRNGEARLALLSELRDKYDVSLKLEPIRIEVAATGPALGPESAPVTVVEFSDFQCPYCARVVPTLKQLTEEYGDKVRLVFRQFPLHSIHPNAQKAAEASLCADEQGKFWAMHDLMFAEQQQLAVEQLKEKAGRLELDQEAFDECLDSSRFAEQVTQDLRAGSDAGVSGTPAMFVNGRFLNGAQPYEAIAAVVDQELERAGADGE